MRATELRDSMRANWGPRNARGSMRYATMHQRISLSDRWTSIQALRKW